MSESPSNEQRKQLLVARNPLRWLVGRDLHADVNTPYSSSSWRVSNALQQDVLPDAIYSQIDKAVDKNDIPPAIVKQAKSCFPFRGQRSMIYKNLSTGETINAESVSRIKWEQVLKSLNAATAKHNVSGSICRFDFYMHQKRINPRYDDSLLNLPGATSDKLLVDEHKSLDSLPNSNLDGDYESLGLKQFARQLNCKSSGLELITIRFTYRLRHRVNSNEEIDERKLDVLNHPIMQDFAVICPEFVQAGPKKLSIISDIQSYSIGVIDVMLYSDGLIEFGDNQQIQFELLNNVTAQYLRQNSSFDKQSHKRQRSQ